MKRRLLYIILTLFLIAACTPKQPATYMLRPHEDPENCWSLWEADLWKMQKAFADYAAMDRPAECPEEKRKDIREGMQLFIDKYDALWY